ncbi:retinoic acid-induced protein 1-like isoform X2 [Lineus longissimus]
MNQYSSESNGPGPYMGNSRMPPMNYNQSNSLDMAYHQGGCMPYNNQGTYNNQYMPPSQYPPSSYGSSYPNHMYGPMNHQANAPMPMPGPGPGPYPNSCPPPAMQAPPPQSMNDNLYPASGSDPTMLPPYPNGQPQTMGYFSSMINSPLPASPHQMQGSSPVPAPTPTPPVRLPGQFAYPGASPLHPQSRTSPISPMMVRSPASVHSNHSIPSSSPGPISSPVQGVKSPLSINSSGMMSPNSNQSLRSPNQPMRSPHANHPLNSPNHMNQSMTPSPQTHAMMSPNHQGHFSPPASVTPGGMTMSSSSNTSHSNGPLQSLQKLVMQPEKRVVDPKSVVGDNGLDGGTRCLDGRHCSTDSEMNNIDMCGRNELGEAECRPSHIPPGQESVHDKMMKIEQYSPGRFSNRCSESSGSPRRLSEDCHMRSPQRLVGRRKSDRMSTGSHPDSRHSVEGESDRESAGRSRKNSGRSLCGEIDVTNPAPQIKSDCPDGPSEHESAVTQRTNSDSEEVIVDSPMVKVEIDDPNTPIPGGSGETPKKKRGRPFGSKTKVRKDTKEKDKEAVKGKKGRQKKLIPPDSVEKKPFVGPTLKLDGPKDKPTWTIVNHRQTEYEKVENKKKQSRPEKKERSVSQALLPDMPLTNAPWVCCFCGRGSTYQRLGDLFGPYFIEGFKPPVVRSEKRITSPKISGPVRPKKRKSWEDDDSEIFLYDHPKQKKKRASTDGKSPKDSDKKGGSTSSGAKDSKPDSGEAWVHEECAAWAQGVYMVGSKLQGLAEAAKIAIQTTCSGCKNHGASIGCLQKGCNQKYHYLCAVDKDCLMNEDNFSLFCPKHKNKKIKMIGSFEKGT